MTDEIFGPVLPVLATDGVDDAVAVVNADDKPLALYVFSEDEGGRRGARPHEQRRRAVNGTIFHVSNPDLPFGGVGRERHRRLPRPIRLRHVQPPAGRARAQHQTRSVDDVPALLRQEGQADPRRSRRPDPGPRAPVCGMASPSRLTSACDHGNVTAAMMRSLRSSASGHVRLRRTDNNPEDP